MNAALDTTTPTFADRLLAWYDREGRKDLPWQRDRHAYRVWVSEIMLQQTQVATVIGYFDRFMARFPRLRDLAEAPLDDVLALWAGLGYYTRARNLHRAAQACVERHDGELPRDIIALADLPGIGRSTAGAILAQAHGDRHAILDGNARRVLARHAGIEGAVEQTSVQRALWQLAEDRLPTSRLADYTQAMMDLGATLCTRRRPACARCPVRDDCVALARDIVEQLPGKRATRAVPTRRTRMLIARDAQGRVLVERRPPTGIWGGLFSLPQIDEGEDARAVFAERYGLKVDAPRALAPFTHVFSHFKLEIQPEVYPLAAPSTRARDDDALRWLDLTQLDAVGLPRPVRELLDTLGD